MTEDLPPVEPGVSVGPYRLLERIAAGGMGEVWRAADERVGAEPAEVALKLIAAERLDDADARARFDREVEAARRIEVPEVAAVVDADPRAPRPWLASVFVPGDTLAGRVARSGPLAHDDLRSLGVGLARGLGAIHRGGVVHRDLTPGNVVLGPDGPVIVDFGVSRIDDATTITRAGSLVGTPAWMAPEQLRDDTVSDASDVWAWGAVMAYASTGRPPITGARTETVIARVLDGVPDLADVPAWIEPLIARAMAADPAHRPTADDLLVWFDRRGRTEGASVTRVDPATRVAPDHVRPTAPGAVPSSAGVSATSTRWSRPVVRAALLGAAVIVGIAATPLLAVVLCTVGVLIAGAVRVWTVERRDGAAPVVSAATVFLAAVLLLATTLSSVVGVPLALAAVVGLIVLFVAIGGDLG